MKWIDFLMRTYQLKHQESFELEKSTLAAFVLERMEGLKL